MSATRRKGPSRTLQLLVLTVLVLFGWWLWREIGGTTNNPKTVRITIPRGTTVRAAGDSLARARVIASSRFFRWYAKTTGVARAIKPGAYLFGERTGYAEVLEALVEGRGIMHTVVIPEGYDLRDITPLLVKALGVTSDSVRVAATDSAWRVKLNVPAPSLEGYLFPATYSFADGTTAREAITEMLVRFESVWRPEWDAQLQTMSISRHAAMSMASIVEKEARKSEERPIIAAVYWNRVKKGMLLQADPTVQYALPAHVDRVFYKDLDVDSKYNTYRFLGLPPGPIASPGEASIVAALHPANVPYLYFVAHPDGHHEFRTTFAEHRDAIASVKRAAKSGQGKASNSAVKAPATK